MRLLCAICAVYLSMTAAVAWGATDQPVHRATQAELALATSGGAAAVGSSAPGVAQAFQVTAHTTGTTNSVSVYVAPSTRAQRLVVGLYSNRSGRPVARLATGTKRHPVKGNWNAIRIGSAAIKAGQTYWLAMLGTGGRFAFRARHSASCRALSSRQRDLTALPVLWATGGSQHLCNVAARVKGSAVGRVATVTDPSGPTVTAPVLKTTPTSAPSNSTKTTTTTTLTDPLPIAAINLAAPTITGSAAQGDVLTTSKGSWVTDPNPTDPTAFAYQWETCNSVGATCSVIAGATASTFRLVAADVGLTMRSIVSATDAAGSTSSTSSATNVVTVTPPPSAPVNTTAPTVSGTAQAGNALTSSTGSWTNAPTNYQYQWQDCNASGTGCSDISGATSASYTVTSNDVGDTIRSVVTATNAGGSAAADSAVTSTVTSAPSGGGGSGSVSPSVFVAQGVAGSGSGSSCADAESVAWFNASGSWGSGSGKIGPGSVVGLCGLISTGLVAHGSGSSGNPITIQWQPGATLSSADWGGGSAFSTNGNTYLTLDGGSDGSIQATAEGSGLADQGVASVGINALGCTGCTFENLTIANLYQHTSASDTSVDQTQDNAIRFSGSHLTIADNTIHDVGWALYAEWRNGDANNAIYGNDISDTDHAFASTSSFAGGSIGPLSFYDNNLHDYADWDTSNDAYHHDGIHCYTSDNGAGPSHYTGFYIYNNTFGGSTGANMTAQIFLEGGSGSGATPCADASSPIWVFNNIGSVSQDVNNGVFGIFSGTPHVLNNTLIGADTSDGVGYATNSDATGQTFENNVVSTANQVINTSRSYFTSGQPNNNIYANGGSNAFVCGSNFYKSTQFSSWQSCMSADANSSYHAGAGLSSSGAPQTGSPALGAGTNLTSLCTGNLTALCTTYTGPQSTSAAGSTTNGTTRPTTGAWNAGAY